MVAEDETGRGVVDFDCFSKQHIRVWVVFCSSIFPTASHGHLLADIQLGASGVGVTVASGHDEWMVPFCKGFFFILSAHSILG